MWSVDTIHFLTQAEMRSLFRVTSGNKRDHAIFLIGYRHGLRCSEIGILTINDVDFSTNQIRLHRVKKSLSGVHPMQPDEARAIRSYLRQRDDSLPYLFLSRKKEPISTRQLDRMTKAYAEKAGIPAEKRHFHVLKHSIATHLLESGADSYFVQNWVGHKNMNNTAIYTHLTAGWLEEQARKMAVDSRVV